MRTSAFIMLVLISVPLSVFSADPAVLMLTDSDEIMVRERSMDQEISDKMGEEEIEQDRERERESDREDTMERQGQPVSGEQSKETRERREASGEMKEPSQSDEPQDDKPWWKFWK